MYLYPSVEYLMMLEDEGCQNANRPRGHKNISCTIQLSMTFFLPHFPVINVKMPTTVGISTFMSRKNSILGLSEPEKR